MNGKLMVLSASLILASPVAMAAVSDADLQALKDSIAALNQKLSDMEKEMAAEKAKSAGAQAAAASAAPAVKPSASAWAEKVGVKGDFRFRYEDINQEDSDKRNRDRLRARVAIVGRPQSDLEVGFGLGTAQDADPVSSNQTIGNGGSRKGIYLDLAYFNWTAAEGLNLIGGKFKNDLYRPGKNGLIWDADLNPEGFGVTYVNGPFFTNLLGTWIQSDSNSTKATGIGGQVGVKWPLTEALKLTVGGGYFDLNTAGKGAFYVVPGSSPNFYGNSVDASNRYLYNYEEIEGFAELGFRLLGLPGSIFFDYVHNADADSFDTGWATGAKLGAAKAKGTWELAYTYQDLEPDAVFGLWTDSDFGGGGTDNSGHILRGAYALSDRTNLAVSYFINKINKDVGNELDYHRLQLDMNFKY